jgi:hypothetical protein
VSGTWTVEAVGDEVLLMLADDEPGEDGMLVERRYVLTPFDAADLGRALLHHAPLAGEVTDGP